MGKLCTNRYLGGGTMRTVMCEKLDVTALPRLLEMQDRAQNDCIRTVSVLENNEDVEVLKLRAQAREKLLSETIDHAASMAPSISSSADDNLVRSFKSDMAIDNDVTINGEIYSRGAESIAVTASDSHGQNGCHEGVNGSSDLSLVVDHVTDTACDRTCVTPVQSPNCETSESGTLNTSPGDVGGNQLDDLSTRYSNTSQMAMTVTQDVAVNVSACNNRLSRVLENIPLVYIPTTKQLGLMTTESVTSQSQTADSQITASSNCSNAIDSVGADEQKEYRHCESVSINDDEHDLHIDCTDVESHNEKIIEKNARETRQPQKHDSLKSDKTDKTDASSFSSISSISTGTELSLSAVSAAEDSADLRNALLEPEDAEFMEINLHSRNSYEPTRGAPSESPAEEDGAKAKKKALSGFRNLFSRKTKDVVNTPSYQSAPGWKLFGRIPPKQSEKKEASQILEEYQAKQRSGSTCSINDIPPTTRTKKQDIEVLSTTALILENRPMNLPSKSPEEEQRHRLEYEAMVEAAKKKEMRELRQKKKHLQQQLKQEDRRVASAKFWNNEILPNWDQMHNHKKTRELWWLGLPPNIRGKVWKLAIGNELNLTPELYEICLSRAQDRLNLLSVENGEPNGPSETSSEPPSSKESSVELIKLDVARTFPQLCIFQKGGPYYDLLHSLLGAYACYRPDVGYVQGMSFIAAVLLLNMDVAEAFICFANLLNRPCQVAFFRMDESLMKSYFQTFEEFFRENMPKLHQHFVRLSVTPDFYIIDWIFTLFSKSLPLDVACRVWDVFCRDGEEFLFRTALGLLKMYEDILLNQDFIHLAQFMTKLPEVISGDMLFKCTDSIKMTIDKKRFAQVMAGFREVIVKES